MDSKLSTKIRLMLAIHLARDIQVYKSGDVSRFDRMVNSHGKGVISYQDAITIIKDTITLKDVLTHWPNTCMALRLWLDRM